MKARRILIYVSEGLGRRIIPLASTDTLLKPGQKLRLTKFDQDGFIDLFEISGPDLPQKVTKSTQKGAK